MKDDWDVSLRPPLFGRDVVGHFAGREKEISRLVNELQRKKSGSIFITGHRGVGKTSFVYKAISDVYDDDKSNSLENSSSARRKISDIYYKYKGKDKSNILIVLLNAGQLEIPSENNKTIDPKEVLITIIRRLYSSSHNWDLKHKNRSQIESLYHKAIASKYYRRKSHSGIDENINIAKYTKIKSVRFEHFVYLVFWILASFFQFNILPSGAFDKILPLILAIPAPFFINVFLSYTKLLSNETRRINEIKAKEFYEFDSNIGNLEFDLEEIHNDISSPSKKIIYVIDELDKMDEEKTTSIVTYLKNLFTLSNALFIFVTGEEIHNHFEKNGVNKYRPKEYTYFTSKYFLSRPLTDDLNSYLDDIIEINELSEKDFKIFSKALCFEAHNDFFDLKTFIKDRITGFDESKPIIEFENITEDDIQKARFQHAITILFEEKYMSSNQSKWDENEHMLRALYSHAHNIYSSYPGATFDDPEEDSNIAEIKRDFNKLLQRYDVFDVEDETSEYIKGLEVSIIEYTYSGSIQYDLPSHLDELLEFERRFINAFETYRVYLIGIINAFEITKNGNKVDIDTFVESPAKYIENINGWGFNFLKIYNDYYRVYSEIVGKNPSRDYKRDGISKRTEDIENHTRRMLAILPRIMGSMVQNLYSELELQFQDINQNTSLLGGPKNEIRNKYFNINPHVLFDKDLSHQMSLHNNKNHTPENFNHDIEANDILIHFYETTKSIKLNDSYVINTEKPDDFEKSILELIKHTKTFFKM